MTWLTQRLCPGLLLLLAPALMAPVPGVIWPEGVYMASIPLKKAGRLFMLEATIDGVTGNLILDTGASGLVLNSTYFRNYYTVNNSAAGGVTGLTGEIRKTTVKRLEYSGLLYTNVGADVANLGHIENRRGVKVLGLLGSSMLRNMEVVIDIAGSQLRLYRLDKSGQRIGSTRSPFKPDITTRIQLIRDVIFLKATIGNKELNFCFDTGAESNMLCSDAPNAVMNTVSILRRSDLQGVSGGRSDVLYATLGDFSLGSRKITGMQALISNLCEMSSLYECQVDGMLGYDFLEQGVISVNMVTRQMGIIFRKGGTP